MANQIHSVAPVKSTIKNILLGLGLVFVILILAVTFVVDSIWHAAAAYQDTSGQSVQATLDGFTITTALKTRPRIILEGVELCGLGVDPPNTYSHGFQCVNGKCKSEIGTNDDTPFPQDLTVYTQSDAGCTAQTISNVAQYQKIFYEGEVKFSPEFLKDNGLDIKDEPTKNANSQFHDTDRIGILGTETIRLNYRSGKPTEDDFLLKEKHFHIVYQ